MTCDKSKLLDKKKKSFIVTHNLKGNNVVDWVKQFKENEQYRKRKRTDSVYLTHEILSWHKEDTKDVSIEKMLEITKEYIKKRNPRGIYLAIPHFDKDHYHIHICASGIEYKTGKSLRISRAEFQKLKRDIQNYQIEHFPELSKSVVDHQKKNKNILSEKEYQIKLRTGRATDKEQVIEILKTCFKASNSKTDFYQKLKECGLKTYDRGGKTTGVLFGNTKFRLNRLGFTEERIEDLNKSEKRGKELNVNREKKEKTINRLR